MTDYSTYHGFVGEVPNQLVASALKDFQCVRGSALDLGAGNLRDSKFLKREGFERVVAVDRSEDSLPYAVEGIELVIRPVQRYYPKPASFDLVISCNTLFFVSEVEIEQILARVYRALRPRGLFAFNILGDLDPWGQRPGITTFARRDAMELIRRYKVEGQAEDRRMLPLASGGSKLWHQHAFVLRKI